MFIIPEFNVSAGAIRQQIHSGHERAANPMRQLRAVQPAGRSDSSVRDFVRCSDLKARHTRRQPNLLAVHLPRQQPGDAATQAGEGICAPGPVNLIANFVVTAVDQHCGSSVARQH